MALTEAQSHSNVRWSSRQKVASLSPIGFLAKAVTMFSLKSPGQISIFRFGSFFWLLRGGWLSRICLLSSTCESLDSKRRKFLNHRGELSITSFADHISGLSVSCGPAKASIYVPLWVI